MNALRLSLVVWAFAVGASADPAAAAGIGDLTWMAGRWVDDSGGDVSEETWLPPSGDCMVGMWRWVGGGKAKCGVRNAACGMDGAKPGNQYSVLST